MTGKRKRKLAMPDTLIIVASVVLLVAILSWIIPSGTYDYQEMNINGRIRNVAIDGTYHTIDKSEVTTTGFLGFFSVLYRGCVEAADVIFMILCCCVSIPRTAAVGIEMGLQGIWPGAPYLVFVILYFVIAFLFAKDRGTALDKVGKILTPIMTIILFILVVKGAVSPIGTPGAASVDNAFVNSFLGGYSTGDVLVSFLAAGVFFDSIKRKGYEGEAFRKAHVRACLIAAVCLAIVYGGLLYMGACVSTEYTPDSISNANLLLAIIRSSGGQIAIYGLCLSVVLACLTTAISQITAVADFYETATHGKLSYKVLVMIVPIVTTIVASFGLDTIVSLTSPWFSFFYPITLVMTILGIFEKKIPNDGAFKGAVYFTVIYAVLDLPHEYGFGFLDPVLNHIPLYGLGFGWIVPAIVGFIVGLIVWKGKGRTET